MVHCPFEYMINNIFYIDCCVRCHDPSSYCAATLFVVMSHCLEKSSNYHHQSKIDFCVATTKHFTGLIGASLAKCIWSHTSLKYRAVKLYCLSNLYCSVSQMGFMHLVTLMKMCSFICMWLDSCSPECCRECQEVTQAEEMWVAWLSEDSDETGQLYRSGARCSIRLDLNIALENRSYLPIPPRVCGTPAQS